MCFIFIIQAISKGNGVPRPACPQGQHLSLRWSDAVGTPEKCFSTRQQLPVQVGQTIQARLNGPVPRRVVGVGF